MLSRGELGALFNRPANESALGTTAGAAASSSAGFRPTHEPLRAVARLRAGKVPDWALPASAPAPTATPFFEVAPQPEDGAALESARLLPPPPPPPPRHVAVVEAAILGVGGRPDGVGVTPAILLSAGVAAPADDVPAPVDVEDAQARRARLRERLSQRRREEEAAAVSEAAGGEGGAGGGMLPNPHSSVAVRLAGSLGQAAPMLASVAPPLICPEEEDGSSGSGSEEEAEAGVGAGDAVTVSAATSAALLFRPVFRGKEQRATLIEAAAAAAAAEEAAAAAAARAAVARVAETRDLICHSLQQEEEAAAADAAEDKGRPNDTDAPQDEDADLDAWRLRELRRVSRDLDAKAAAAAEARETARRRGLNDAERAREDAALEAAGLRVFVKQRDVLPAGSGQRFLHRGAFYMDEDTLAAPGDVRARPITAPTQGEAYDRSAMPRAMAAAGLAKWGRKGQVKPRDGDTTRVERGERGAPTAW